MAALPLLETFWVEYEDQPVVADPNPLNASVNEGATLSASSVITETSGGTVNISVFSGSKPSWVSESLIIPNGAPIPTPVTLTLSGTAPYTGAESSTGSPFSWVYAITNGVDTTYLTVNLTVVNQNIPPGDPTSTLEWVTPSLGQPFSPEAVIELEWVAETDADDATNTLKYNIQTQAPGAASFVDIPGLPETGGGFGLTVADATMFTLIMSLSDPAGLWNIRIRAWDGNSFGPFVTTSFTITPVTDIAGLTWRDPDTAEVWETLAWTWSDPVYSGFTANPRVREFQGNLTVNRQVSKADARRGPLVGGGSFLPDDVARRILDIVHGRDITHDWHNADVYFTDLFGMVWRVTIVNFTPIFNSGLAEWNWSFVFAIEEDPTALRTGCEED